jgi:hypothetical protein
MLNVTGLWDGAALLSTPNFNAGGQGEVFLLPGDRSILRELAEKVAGHAASPPQRHKRELWRRHNDLEPVRPLVFCDPENGWNEILPSASLRCRSALARRWEMVLRKELFWAESLLDDKVIEPFFDIGYTHSEDDWGLNEKQIGGTEGGSYVWEAALSREADIEKLHPPAFRIDLETTRQTVSLAEDTYGDLLRVRLTGVWWWSLGLTLNLSLLRGLEQVMYDLVERPQLVHRLMGILRDGYLQKLDYLEANGFLSPNTDLYVGSGGFGYTSQLPAPAASGAVRTKELWGFAESQETVGVSPAMFAEFILPYQLPLLKRFGLNCYGCCEPLDSRWAAVKQVPNLRRVSVSAWANLEKMAQLLEARYVLSWKPNPADLARPRIDEPALRKQLRRSLEITRGCRVEIIMKDNHTLAGNPQNAVRWVQIAKQEAERIGNES